MISFSPFHSSSNKPPRRRRLPIPPSTAVTMPAPSDLTLTFPSSPEPARALSFLSSTPLAKPAPPPPDYFVVNILALLKLIAGNKLAETSVTSPAPSEAVKTSPAPALPEFSVVDIPNWEISATTSASPQVSATTAAPSEVTITALPPVKTADSVNVRKHSMRMVQIIVRNLAAMATLAASIIMLFNEEPIHLSGVQLTANYKFSPAFKFFVIGNGFACIYAFTSMIIIISCGSNLAMHFLDTLIMGLVVAAAAAATAVSYIGKKGNANAHWQPVCNYAEDYCYHSTVSIACSYLGFFLLLLVFTLTFMSKLSIYNVPME